VNLGGGPLQVGLLNGIGYAAELPGMLVAGWLVSRIGPRNVLATGCVGFGLTAAAYVVLTEVPAIIAARFLAGIFFCLIFVASVVTVSRLLPPRLQSTGQTLLGASSFGAGAILANPVGGWLYGAFGPAGAFGLAAACAFAGAGVGFLAVPAGVPVQARAVESPEPVAIPAVDL